MSVVEYESDIERNNRSKELVTPFLAWRLNLDGYIQNNEYFNTILKQMGNNNGFEFFKNVEEHYFKIMKNVRRGIEIFCICYLVDYDGEKYFISKYIDDKIKIPGNILKEFQDKHINNFDGDIKIGEIDDLNINSVLGYINNGEITIFGFHLKERIITGRNQRDMKNNINCEIMLKYTNKDKTNIDKTINEYKEDNENDEDEKSIYDFLEIKTIQNIPGRMISEGVVNDNRLYIELRNTPFKLYDAFLMDITFESLLEQLCKYTIENNGNTFTNDSLEPILHLINKYIAVVIDNNKFHYLMLANERMDHTREKRMYIRYLQEKNIEHNFKCISLFSPENKKKYISLWDIYLKKRATFDGYKNEPVDDFENYIQKRDDKFNTFVPQWFKKPNDIKKNNINDILIKYGENVDDEDNINFMNFLKKHYYIPDSIVYLDILYILELIDFQLMHVLSGGDKYTGEYIINIILHALLTSRPIGKIINIYGTNGTGKSTFFVSLQKLFGPRTVTIEHDISNKLGNRFMSAVENCILYVCEEFNAYNLKHNMADVLKYLATAHHLNIEEKGKDGLKNIFNKMNFFTLTNSTNIPDVDSNERRWIHLQVNSCTHDPSMKKVYFDELTFGMENYMALYLDYAYFRYYRNDFNFDIEPKSNINIKSTAKVRNNLDPEVSKALKHFVLNGNSFGILNPKNTDINIKTVDFYMEYIDNNYNEETFFEIFNGTRDIEDMWAKYEKKKNFEYNNLSIVDDLSVYKLLFPDSYEFKRALDVSNLLKKVFTDVNLGPLLKEYHGDQMEYVSWPHNYFEILFPLIEKNGNFGFKYNNFFDYFGKISIGDAIKKILIEEGKSESYLGSYLYEDKEKNIEKMIKDKNHINLNKSINIMNYKVIKFLFKTYMKSKRRYEMTNILSSNKIFKLMNEINFLSLIQKHCMNNDKYMVNDAKISKKICLEIIKVLCRLTYDYYKVLSIIAAKDEDEIYIINNLYNEDKQKIYLLFKYDEIEDIDFSKIDENNYIKRKLDFENIQNLKKRKMDDYNDDDII